MRQLLMLVMLMSTGCGMRACAEAQDVVHEELGPRAMLRKYEWFKDAYANLQAQEISLNAYRAQEQAVIDDYGEDRTKWPRDVRDERRMARAERTGMVAAYNGLAADYNSNMSKAHWDFTNIGQLPPGLPADAEPLPRTVATYKDK